MFDELIGLLVLVGFGLLIYMKNTGKTFGEVVKEIKAVFDDE